MRFYTRPHRYEAAVLYLRKNPPAPRYVARLPQKHGKGKALTILAHKLARAVYHMLRREQAFEAAKFFSPAARTERPARPDSDGGAHGAGHDALRSGPTQPDLEGAHDLNLPDITRRGSRRRVHERDSVTTTQGLPAPPRALRRTR